MDIGIGDQDIITGILDPPDEYQSSASQRSISNIMPAGDMRLPSSEPVSWEMVSLGLEEPLPPIELMDEL